MRRREFLKVGTAGALSALALGGGVNTIRETGSKARAANLWLASPLSVGYWNGDASSTVVLANSLRRGDSRFAQTGADLRLIGLKSTSGDVSFDGVDLLTVDVDFHPFHNVQYSAWILDNSGTQKVSSPVSCFVPIAASNGLTLSVGLQLTGAAMQQVSVNLATQFSLLSPKLQQGYYFLGLSKSSGSNVNWSSYVAQGSNGAVSLAVQPGGPSPRSFWPIQPVSAPTDLDYFVFSVQHAG